MRAQRTNSGLRAFVSSATTAKFVAGRMDASRNGGVQDVVQGSLDDDISGIQGSDSLSSPSGSGGNEPHHVDAL